MLRVTALVADKVLDLYRNPNPRLSQVSQTMESDSVTRAYSRDAGRTGAAISLIDAELNSVKLYRPRSIARTIPIAPWTPRTPWAQWGWGVPCRY